MLSTTLDPVFLLLALTGGPRTALVPLELSPLASDGAVLQRGVEVPIRGPAEPGVQVAATFAGARYVALDGFAVAGADRRFVRADAVIEGNGVVVWSEHVPDPVAVRYACADNPDGANLYNAEGLPAAPFRTDDW